MKHFPILKNLKQWLLRGLFKIFGIRLERRKAEPVNAVPHKVEPLVEVAPTPESEAKAPSRNRKVSLPLTYKGETKSRLEWDEIQGFPKGTITTRLNNGMSVERAIEAPYHPRPHHHKKKPVEAAKPEPVVVAAPEPEAKVSWNTKGTLITYNGKTQTCAEWDAEKGYPKGTIQSRRAQGMSTQIALITPYKPKPAQRIYTPELKEELKSCQPQERKKKVTLAAIDAVGARL